MKAVKTEEGYITKLKSGIYLIEGEVKEISGGYNGVECILKSLDVRPITRSRQLQHYLNADQVMSIEDYIDEKRELTKGVEIDDYDGEYEWNDLDKEYAYRKFLQLWKPIYKDIEVIGDPISFDTVGEVKLDTGNPYIRLTCQTIDKSDIFSMNYTYHRMQATANIVKDKFSSLGFKFIGDNDRAETSRRKVWTNSTHSHLRYAKAFGSYIFNDNWSNCYDQKYLTLADAEARYQADKETLENIIQTQYDSHFHEAIIIENLEKIANSKSCKKELLAYTDELRKTFLK